MRLKPSTPIFPFSNTPFPSYASEIFLSSLQTEVSATPKSCPAVMGFGVGGA